VCSELAVCFMLVSCLAYSSTLTMEAVYYSETSVGFHQITRRYIPEELIRHKVKISKVITSW
jgi:hypothetical protein